VKVWRRTGPSQIAVGPSSSRLTARVICAGGDGGHDSIVFVACRGPHLAIAAKITVAPSICVGFGHVPAAKDADILHVYAYRPEKLRYGLTNIDGDRLTQSQTMGNLFEEPRHEHRNQTAAPLLASRLHGPCDRTHVATRPARNWHRGPSVRSRPHRGQSEATATRPGRRDCSRPAGTTRRGAIRVPNGQGAFSSHPIAGRSADFVRCAVTPEPGPAILPGDSRRA
jgi:hypothetical protein